MPRSTVVLRAIVHAHDDFLKNPSTGQPFDAGVLASADLHGLNENREAALGTLRDAAKGAGLTCAAEFLAAH